jgi:hypothetical protein
MTQFYAVKRQKNRRLFGENANSQNSGGKKHLMRTDNSLAT